MRLQDKVAVITGAAQGIGLGIAQRFSKEGARVMMLDVNEDVGARAAADKDLAGRYRNRYHRHAYTASASCRRGNLKSSGAGAGARWHRHG